jgi:hypothetical protein
MKLKLALASLLIPSLSFAQNATVVTSEWFSPYYPLINSPYIAGTITLVRDVTIIVVLWMILFKQFGDKEKAK